MYFLDDALCHDNVLHDDIKVPLIKGGKASSDMNSFVNKIFSDEGGEGFEPGEFQVIGVGEDNNFVCKRLGSVEEPEQFDMGYTIRRINLYDEE